MRSHSNTTCRVFGNFAPVVLTLVFVLTSVGTLRAQQQPEVPPLDEVLVDDFWYDILTISEESPRLEGEIWDPIVVQLPDVETATPIRWQTEGEIAVYRRLLSDGEWRIQRPYDEITYEGGGEIAFLPHPDGATFALGYGIASGVCKFYRSPLKGRDTLHVSGYFSSGESAEKEAVDYVPTQVVSDRDRKARGFCPDLCPIPITTDPTWKIIDSDYSYSLIGSLFSLGSSWYTGWATFEWESSVQCTAAE